MNARHLAIVSLVLLPLLWLWPCVFGGRTFVPYDIGQYPPTSVLATDEQLQQAREDANYDVTEVPIWFLPELELAHGELAAGRFPGWNPHARSGAPLHAHGLIGLFYPPNWLALASDEPGRRLVLVAWCNLVIGGLLAFGLLRQLGFAVLPAWLGAMLFELSGPMAANSFFWMRLGSLVWLPGVLWAMLRIAGQQRARPLAVLALGLTFAMPWLAGFPPFAATTTVFTGIALLWLVGERWRQSRAAAIRLALPLLVGLAIGALWALPQVLPSLLFFPESARPPTPLWRDIAGQSFGAYGLLGYLAPDAFGHPTMLGTLPYKTSAMQLLLNGDVHADGSPAVTYNYTEYAVYVSTFGALLAVLGAVVGRGRRANLARTAFVLALGLAMFWPGLRLLFHLPIVQNVWPMRWLAAAGLFVGWLAALGCERLLASARRLPLIAAGSCLGAGLLLWFATAYPANQHQQDRGWIVRLLGSKYDSDDQGVINYVQGARTDVDRFAASLDQFANAGQSGAWWLCGTGALLLALAGLRNTRHRRLLVLAGAAIAALQLGMQGGSITRGAPRAIANDSPAHGFLREQAAQQQDAGGFAIVRATRLPQLPEQLPPGQLMESGIRDLNFYSHADARSLQPVRRLLEDYAERLGLPPTAGEVIAGKGYLTQSLPAALLAHPYFDLIGVRYLLTNQKLDGFGEPVGPTVKGRGEFFIYACPSAMSRAVTLPAVVACDDDEAVIISITDEAFRPRRQAYALRSDLPAPLPRSDTAGSRVVTFAIDHPGRIELDVAAGESPWLLLTDTFLPGWTVTIDGAPADIVRGNHSQRLVLLPDTACRVIFTYAAPGLTAGLLLAGFATLGALVWWFATRRPVGVTAAES